MKSEANQGRANLNRAGVNPPSVIQVRKRKRESVNPAGRLPALRLPASAALLHAKAAGRQHHEEAVEELGEECEDG